MDKGFILLNTYDAMAVSGGTEMEDAARSIGRLIGRLVGTIEKLLDKSKSPQASASF